MPYTDAVIHEILRHSCLVYAVPQATTTAVELDEYVYASNYLTGERDN
jgi:hypothetical protein